MLLHYGLHGADAIAVQRGAFVIHRLCRLRHALGQRINHRRKFAVQEIDHAVNLLRVFLFRDQIRARRAALPHLMVHARALGLGGIDFQIARAHGKYAAHHVQHLAHDGRALIGAEVFRAVLFLFARKLRTRKRIGQIDADIGIMLIILQKDVVMRAVALDQIAFQRECFQFAVHQNDIEIIDLFHHRAHLRRVVFRCVEILRYAVFQILRLAHVDDFALMLHQIASGRIGQVGNLPFQIRGQLHRHTRFFKSAALAQVRPHMAAILNAITGRTCRKTSAPLASAS